MKTDVSRTFCIEQQNNQGCAFSTNAKNLIGVQVGLLWLQRLMENQLLPWLVSSSRKILFPARSSVCYKGTSHEQNKATHT
ncbi:hypothetical protein OUZ56_011920 [Daphnia magna]|uniref:Uncharacterized protein n=1 Tax=Daphnia magna TaxID=35525 RepID=A0ABQ9Z1I6_9CRUS|nr:hypothetical protein OUZ56_011920 [Daphnia magna]